MQNNKDLNLINYCSRVPTIKITLRTPCMSTTNKVYSVIINTFLIIVIAIHYFSLVACYASEKYPYFIIYTYHVDQNACQNIYIVKCT